MDDKYPPFDGSQLCAQTDPELWFPTADSQTGKVAKSLCRKCPWKQECLTYALHHDLMGIWGATTERERRGIRKQLGIKAQPMYLDNLVKPPSRETTIDY